MISYLYVCPYNFIIHRLMLFYLFTDSMALLESEILIIENDGKIAEINITLQTEEEEIFGRIVLPEHVYMGMGIYLSTTGWFKYGSSLVVYVTSHASRKSVNIPVTPNTLKNALHL